MSSTNFSKLYEKKHEIIIFEGFEDENIDFNSSFFKKNILTSPTSTTFPLSPYSSNKYMIEEEIEVPFVMTEEDLLYIKNFFEEKNIFENVLSSNNMFETCIQDKEPYIFCFRPNLQKTLDDILKQIIEDPLLMKNCCLVDIGQDSFYGYVYLYKGTCDRLFLFLIDWTMNYYII
jgi:hypothetical protein